MQLQDAVTEIAEIIEELFQIEAGEITAETHFEKNLDLEDDELEELRIEIEDAFGVEIPDNIAENLTTVGALGEWLIKHAE
ncbi:MAG: phosphopantetheine-binding protein [bacterium]